MRGKNNMKKIITMAIGTILLFVLAGCNDPKQAKKEASQITKFKTRVNILNFHPINVGNTGIY